MTDTLLTDRLVECVWQTQERQSDISTRGGTAQVMLFGQPYWVINCRYENLTGITRRLMTAWLGRRRGAATEFFAFRPGRTHPAINPSADNSGVGVDSFNQSAGSIRFTGLSGKVIGEGDMVSYLTASGGYFVGEVIEVLSSSASTAVVKTVPPPSPPDASPSPQIVHASGLFRLIPKSVSITDRYDVMSVSFSARQEEP